MKPGTLVTLAFPGANGIKRRPALVVSTENYHNERPDVILALVTTKIQKAISSTDYILQDWSTSGLRQPSAVRMYLHTEDQSQITYMGELSETDWLEVQKRLRLAVEI